METTVIYNGVTIKDVLSDPISVESEKDSTDVDQLGMRVTYSCTGIVHRSLQPNTIGVKVGTNFAAGLDQLLDKLGKDRRPFQLRIGPTVLYDVKPGAAEPNAARGTITANLDAMDIDNGPRTKVTILNIRSGYSATIRFQVTFLIPNCGEAGGSQNAAVPGLVNFRFWIAEDIDCQSWLTSRTYLGRLRVAHKGVSPQAIARAVVVPPLQRGFKRNVIQLHESENGLELDFTIQDQEIIAAAPWSPRNNKGAVSWSGSFSTSTSNFSCSYSELTFRLTGPKGTSKTDLMLIGMSIVSKKTHFPELARNGPGGQAFLEQFAIKEELADNVVDFAVRLRHTADRQVLLGLMNVGGKLEIGQPLGDLGIGYDPQVAFHPAQTATLTGLFLSQLQTPCNPATMPRIVDKPPKKIESKNESQRSLYPLEQPLPSQNSLSSKSHLQAIYMHCEMNSDLIVDPGALALATGAEKDSKQDTRSIVRLRHPTADRVISIDASRIDAFPQLPRLSESFKDRNGITNTMIGEAIITAGAPQLSADNRKMLHTVQMKARYALSRVPRYNEPIPVGALPYKVTNFQDPSRKLPPEIFVDPREMLG